LLGKLATAVEKEESNRFFEFLIDFINSNYTNFTLKNTEDFLNTLVSKVCSDQQMIFEKFNKFKEEYDSFSLTASNKGMVAG